MQLMYVCELLAVASKNKTQFQSRCKNDVKKVDKKKSQVEKNEFSAKKKRREFLGRRRR